MSDEALPTVTGTSAQPINILLINPNSTKTMTEGCLRSIAGRLAPHVTVHGFTAPRPGPNAIEGQVDGVLSTAACLRALVPIIHKYDAFLVSCFSAHPLITALREEVTHQPVMGIMEAALYASRVCGMRLSVLTTSPRSAVLHTNSIATYGFANYSAGCQAADIAVLELETLPKEQVHMKLAETARKLVKEQGADCISLGCAGMTEMQKACAEAVNMDQRQVMIVDGVGVGVNFLVALVTEGLGTAKSGAYRAAQPAREARGQDWY